MKKMILAMVLMLIAGPAMAQHGYRGGYNSGRSVTVNSHSYSYHGGYRGGYYGGGCYGCGVGAAIIGGAIIGAAIAAPHYVAPPVYAAPPVVYGTYQPPVSVPYGYHYQEVIDASCNCARMVLVPN
jgi:hypothetical protein